LLSTIAAVAADQSAPNVAFYRTIHRTIHRAHIDPGSNHDSRNRTWPQHDTRPYDAPGWIFNVLAVHYCTGLFGGYGYEPCDQQRRYDDQTFHFALLYRGTITCVARSRPMHEVKPSEKKVCSKQQGNRSSTQAAMRPIIQILSEILEVLRNFGASQWCEHAAAERRHFTSMIHQTFSLIRHCIGFWPVSCDTNATRDERSHLILTTEAQMRRKLVTLGLSSLTAVAMFSSSFVPAQAQQQKKPNVVKLMTDDTGWTDFGAYLGGAALGHPTPNIDRIASEGAMFTNWYGQASCTAGRASFMTCAYRKSSPSI
jgi:hypothetical protein